MYVCQDKHHTLLRDLLYDKDKISSMSVLIPMRTSTACHRTGECQSDPKVYNAFRGRAGFEARSNVDVEAQSSCFL